MATIVLIWPATVGIGYTLWATARVTTIVPCKGRTSSIDIKARVCFERAGCKKRPGRREDHSEPQQDREHAGASIQSAMIALVPTCPRALEHVQGVRVVERSRVRMPSTTEEDTVFTVAGSNVPGPCSTSFRSVTAPAASTMSAYGASAICFALKPTPNHACDGPAMVIVAVVPSCATVKLTKVVTEAPNNGSAFSA